MAAIVRFNERTMHGYVHRPQWLRGRSAAAHRSFVITNDLGYRLVQRLESDPESFCQTKKILRSKCYYERLQLGMGHLRIGGSDENTTSLCLVRSFGPRWPCLAPSAVEVAPNVGAFGGII